MTEHQTDYKSEETLYHEAKQLWQAARLCNLKVSVIRLLGQIAEIGTDADREMVAAVREVMR